jgi:hypothetical protein
VNILHVVKTNWNISEVFSRKPWYEVESLLDLQIGYDAMAGVWDPYSDHAAGFRQAVEKETGLFYPNIELYHDRLAFAAQEGRNSGQYTGEITPSIVESFVYFMQVPDIGGRTPVLIDYLTNKGRYDADISLMSNDFDIRHHKILRPGSHNSHGA